MELPQFYINSCFSIVWMNHRRLDSHLAILTLFPTANSFGESSMFIFDRCLEVELLVVMGMHILHCDRCQFLLRKDYTNLSFHFSAH